MKLIIAALALASALAVQGRQQPEGAVILIGPGQTGGNAYVTVVSDPANTTDVEVSGLTVTFAAPPGPYGSINWLGSVTASGITWKPVRLKNYPDSGLITLTGSFSGFPTLWGWCGVCPSSSAATELFGSVSSDNGKLGAYGHVMFAMHPPGEPSHVWGGTGCETPVFSHNLGYHDNGYVQLDADWGSYSEYGHVVATIWPEQATAPGQTSIYIPPPGPTGQGWYGSINGLSDGDRVQIAAWQSLGWPELTIYGQGGTVSVERYTRFTIDTQDSYSPPPGMGVFVWHNWHPHEPTREMVWVGPDSWIRYEDPSN